jgi:hypothetical protein
MTPFSAAPSLATRILGFEDDPRLTRARRQARARRQRRSARLITRR